MLQQNSLNQPKQRQQLHKSSESLCRYLTILTSTTRLQQGNIDKPTKIQIWSKQKKVLFLSQKYKKSLQDYDKSISLHSENYFAYIYRGDTLLEMNNNENSFSDYNKAIKINQHVEDVYMKRGIIYENMKYHNLHYKNIGRVFKLTLTKHNFTCEVPFNQSKEYNKAIRDLNKSIQLHPEQIKAQQLLAIVNLNLSQKEPTIQDLKKQLLKIMIVFDFIIEDASIKIQRIMNLLSLILIKQLESNLIYLKRGSVYKVIKRYEEALKDYHMAIDINPNRISIQVFNNY